MKIQDIAFLFVLVLVVLLRKPKISIAIGIMCLLISIPLYSRWIFFTAERLVLYAACFILVGVIGIVLNKRG